MMVSMQLEVLETSGHTLRCRVIDGGVLKSRKGVNFPELNLRLLPSLTEKDKEDLKFGLSQDVDWVSLSFVRSASDVHSLKELIAAQGVFKPVVAKIEKPQAIENLEGILRETNGVMVARGDLGVELNPEKVPMLQKHIIESCNRKGLPVITATQMLESMIRDPRPTRAEASDVANAIIDGTDAVMLSGESAVGAFPVRAVEMMDRIAREVEAAISFKTYPAEGRGNAHALSEAAKMIATTIEPVLHRGVNDDRSHGAFHRCGAAENQRNSHLKKRASLPRAEPVLGAQASLNERRRADFEGLVQLAESTVRARGLAVPGDKILVIGGVPAPSPLGANFLKIHSISAS